VPAKRSLETATGAEHSGVAYASPRFWTREAEPCIRRRAGLSSQSGGSPAGRRQRVSRHGRSARPRSRRRRRPAISREQGRVSLRFGLVCAPCFALIRGKTPTSWDDRSFPGFRQMRNRHRRLAPIGVSGRSESPALPRKKEPVLARLWLTPTARPTDQVGSVTIACLKSDRPKAPERTSATATIQHSDGAGGGLCFATVAIVAPTAWP
jgi:hypothetical protein